MYSVCLDHRVWFSQYTPLLGHSDGFCVLDACAFSSQGQRQGVHGVGKEATVQEEIAVFERVVVDALDTGVRQLVSSLLSVRARS